MRVGFFHDLCDDTSKTENATIFVPSSSVLCRGQRKLLALCERCLNALVNYSLDKTTCFVGFLLNMIIICSCARCIS